MWVFVMQTMSEAAHARATACFERMVRLEPQSSLSWARLAALYRTEYLHDFNPRPDDAPALDRALDAVRKALELDHDNAFAHQELGFISLLRDDPVTARLLNRGGQLMADLPVQQRPGNPAEIELPLSSLAAGEYLIELNARSDGGSTAQELIAFRISR